MAWRRRPSCTRRASAAENAAGRSRPVIPCPVRSGRRPHDRSNTYEKEVSDVLPQAPAPAAAAPVGAADGHGSGSELRGRLRLGGRLLDATASLPRPRLGGRQLLRLRGEADLRQRPRGRGRSRRRRHADGRGDRPSEHGGPGAQERPGTLRSGDGGGPRRRHDPACGARRTAAGRAHRHPPPPVRDLRRGLPRVGPLASAGGGSLVRGEAGRRGCLPGGEVPAAGRSVAP